MDTVQFEFGEQVRHLRRPEWGIGSVTRAETITVEGVQCQRLRIRFPGAGVKVLNTAQAELERVVREEPVDGAPDVAHSERVRTWDDLTGHEWLAPVAQRKLEEAMVALPEAARDPFLAPRERLVRALKLYRFERTGRGLVEWAIAQTGLDDPLSRFNRHELENFFDRWAGEREEWLVRLLKEDRDIRSHVSDVLGSATPEARRIVRRIIGAG